MADLSAFVLGTAQDVAKNEGAGLAEGYAKGAELALRQEQIKQQQQKIEQDQQQLQLAKLEKIGGWYETGSKMEDGGAKKAFLTKFVPGGINALGMSDAIHPTTMDMMSSNPLVVKYAANEIRSGRMNFSDLLAGLANPAKAAQLFASPGFKQFGAMQEVAPALQESIGALKKDADFAASEEGRAYRANLAAEASKSRAGAFVSQAETRKDEQAMTAVKAVNNDPTLTELSKLARNTVNDLGLLRDTKHRPSAITINEIAQNAVKLISQSQVSSDFKLKEINQQTLEGELAKLKSFATSNPDVPAPKPVVDFWLHTIERLDGAFSRHIAARANQLKRELPTALANNPNAVKAATEAAQSHASGEALGKPKSALVKGQMQPVEKLKSFLKDHPDDPMAAEVKKALKEVGE